MPCRHTDYVANWPSVLYSHSHQLQIFLAFLSKLSVGDLTLRYWEAVRNAKSFESHTRGTKLNNSTKVAYMRVWSDFLFNCGEMLQITQIYFHITYLFCLRGPGWCSFVVATRLLSSKSGSPSPCQEECSAELLSASNISSFWRICGLPNYVVLGAKSVLWGQTGELGRETMNLLTC